MGYLVTLSESARPRHHLALGVHGHGVGHVLGEGRGGVGHVLRHGVADRLPESDG